MLYICWRKQKEKKRYVNKPYFPNEKYIEIRYVSKKK